MPKHIIYKSGDTSRIELRWQRDGGVQVASTRWTGDGAPDPAVEYLPGADAEPAWAGEHVELDRWQTNHLIRQLRTARDQAFGRDA